MIQHIHWAWVILLASFATVFMHYSIRLGYGILTPEMILSLKITKAQAGTIASSFFLAYGIFSPIMGFLALAACVFGVFHASVWPRYAAAPADFFPREATGSVLGFWTIFYGVALILAPAVGGYIADVTGTFI